MVEGEHPSFIRRAGARLPGPGDLVGECWRVDAALGQGGMGGVFKATDVRTGRQAALKVMLPGDASRGRLRRFEREAQVLARIAHPGVVRIHASGAHHGMPWFVMELVEGPDLDRLITESGPLEPDRAAELVEQAARAVAACHAAGVIHRDLKPANVIVGPEGAKVVDFGLARGDSDERLTRTGEIVGTPVTMAPEQLMGGAVDARADVYALGAMLYLALTGQPVYMATSLQELVARACHGDPVPPRRLRPAISAGLQEVCLHALRPRAEERYATALELADDLARVRRREVPLASTASSLRDRVRRREPRTLVRLLAVAAGSLGLVALAVWLLVARPRAEAHAALEAAARLEAGPLAAWDLGLGAGAAPDPADLGRHAAALRDGAKRLGPEEAVAAERAAARFEALRGLVAPADAGAAGAPPPWPLDALLEALRLRAAGRPAEAAARVARVLSREPTHPTARRLDAALWADRVAASPRELKALVVWARAADRTDEERAAASAAARVGLAAGLRLIQREAAAATDDGKGAGVALAAANEQAAALGVDEATLATLRVEAAEAEAEAWAQAGARALASGAAADLSLARRLVAAVGPHHGPRLRAAVDAIVLARVDAALALGPAPPLEAVLRASGLEDTLHHGLALAERPPQRYVDLVCKTGDSYMDLDPALSLPYLRLAARRTRAASTIVRRLEGRLGAEALLALWATRPGSVALALAKYVLADETPTGGDPSVAAEGIAAATRLDLSPAFLSEAWTAVAKHRSKRPEPAGAPEEQLRALRQATIAAARRVVELDADPNDLADAAERWVVIARRSSKDEARQAREAALEVSRRRVAAAAGEPSQVLELEQRTLAELYVHAALDLVEFDRRPGSSERAREYLDRAFEAATVPSAEVSRVAIIVHLLLGDLDAAEAAATRGLAVDPSPGGRLLSAATRAALARGDLVTARERLAAAKSADPTWPFTELERDLKAAEDAAR